MQAVKHPGPGRCNVAEPPGPGRCNVAEPLGPRTTPNGRI
jgi:hypothetical protein